MTSQKNVENWSREGSGFPSYLSQSPVDFEVGDNRKKDLLYHQESNENFSVEVQKRKASNYRGGTDYYSILSETKINPQGEYLKVPTSGQSWDAIFILKSQSK